MTTEPTPTEPSLVSTVIEGDTQPGADTAGGTDSQAPSGADSTGGDSQGGTDSVAGEETSSGTDTIAPLTADSYVDLKAPEGLVMDDALLGEAKSVFAEADVNPAEASKLLDVYKKGLEAQATANQTAFTDMRATWLKESKALPEFAGSKLEPALASISKVIDEFGSNEVREVLSATGAGDNPAIAKMMYKIAEALSEGRPTAGGRPPGGQKKSYAELQYGDKT